MRVAIANLVQYSGRIGRKFENFSPGFRVLLLDKNSGAKGRDLPVQ